MDFIFVTANPRPSARHEWNATMPQSTYTYPFCRIGLHNVNTALLNHLRKLSGMRIAAVCSALTELFNKGVVVRDARGYQLKLPFPVSRPIDLQGNGNGKHSLCSSGR
jgi:hypothetical protein